MDNVMYVGLSRQMTLQHEMDVIANNVANVDTAGFKVESLMVETDAEHMPVDPTDSSLPVVNFALDAGVARDFSQGALKKTTDPLAMAIQGKAFFRVSTPAGERYTRDGRFSLDPQGRIVTASGQPVQGDGGDVVVDPTKGQISVASDGTVSQEGQIVGRIDMVGFASLSALAKDGDGLYRNVSNLQPQRDENARLQQGMIESSNVEPITQITRMIEVSRAYESIARMMDQTNDLMAKSISVLGQVS